MTKLRRCLPLRPTVAAGALLLLLLISSSPPRVLGGGGIDDRYQDDIGRGRGRGGGGVGGRSLVGRGKKKKKVAGCLRRKYRETRKYLKCAWPLSKKNRTGESQEEGGGNDEGTKEERMETCGSNIKQKRKGRCLEGKFTMSTADGVVELCRAAKINFPGCKRLSNRFVDYSVGKRISKTPPEKEPSEDTSVTSVPPVDGRMSIVPWSMSDFKPSVVDGYTNCPEFEDDLRQAFLMLADSYIRRQVQDGNIFRKERLQDDIQIQFSEPMATEADGAPLDADEDVLEENSFDTNLQEANVDEADAVKANLNFTFAAYGNLILGWDSITGEIRTRTKIEPIKKLENEEKSCSRSNPRATVRSLLMNENRLVAIVETGYSGCWCWYCYHGSFYGDKSLLSDHAATQVLVYDISNEKIPKPEDFILSTSNKDSITEYKLDAMELNLIGKENLQGTLMAARSIESTAHIVTRSSVQHGQFTQHFSRYKPKYKGMNITAYAAAARTRAEDIAGNFSGKLAEEIYGRGWDCSAEGTIDIMKLSSFGMPSSSDEADEQSGGATDQFLGQNGMINTFVRINSFDFAIDDGAQDVEEALKVATSGAFMPTSHAEVYASQDYLVLGGQLWSRFGRWPLNEWWDHRTYLLAFKLSNDGSAAKGAATGSVPGYTLNQFSFDEHRGYLRVATSSNERNECANLVSTNYTSWVYEVKVGKDKKEKEERTPIIRTYWYCKKWRTVTNSSSQVTVLRLPEADEVGNVNMEFVSDITDLGPTETIKAVRFFNERAFVVTFRQTDPLYSIDFRNMTHPVLADELKIEGFSEYIHPIGDAMLLTVGRDADPESGRATGMQVALFDVAELNNTSLLTKYTVKDAYSEAGSEHKAFRYLPQSKKLLIPVRRWGKGSNDFDGFFVLDIERDSITESFNVSMSEDYGGCYYYANMPPRTLVFKGDATFIKGHSYQSMDLSDKELIWSRDLDFFLEEKDDCYSYWGGAIGRPMIID